MPTFRVEPYRASELGWLRRSDLGDRVWERPDGLLYTHFGLGEPQLMILCRREDEIERA